jgi:hypothetical protein
MTTRQLRYAALAVTLTVMGAPHGAAANPWNDKTILTFSAPVMVPGATLQPGTYEFILADIKSSRHMVQIFTSDPRRLVTTTIAVPVKRTEASEDVVVRFNPTDRGVPPAMKAWFYPGSRYGHQFVYSDEEARHIAGRTKELVLAIDTPGDAEKGVLRTHDATGVTNDWRGDSSTLQEWEQWQRARTNAAANSDTTSDERRRATAPAIDSDFRGTRVPLDALEENTRRYLGQRISVDGEVEDVLGPRLFTIDEPNWGDLDGEVIVFVPSALAALVRKDDRVTVSGTVRPFLRVELEREWGWLGLDPDVEIDVEKKAVLVAERVVGGNNDVALVLEATRSDRPVGTAGSTNAVDLATAAVGDEALVGRRAILNARVSGKAQDRGLFVQSGGTHLFVLPSQGSADVKVGDTVSVEGVVLRLPSGMVQRLRAPGPWNEDIYVFATTLKR